MNGFRRDSKPLSPQDSRALLLALLALLASLGETTFAAPTPPLSIEQRIEKNARLFKPIPDADWAQVAGPKATENYEIVKGDTLYGISKRLFNDPKYWPKIWALNNSSITNPHLIRPSVKIAFAPGSGSSLPSISLQKNAEPPAPAATAEAAGEPKKVSKAADAEPAEPPRSEEWKKLPRQSWETRQEIPDPEEQKRLFRKAVDDARPKKVPRRPSVLVSSDKIEPLGEITGGREAGVLLGLDQRIFIEAEEKLEVGQTYRMLGSPERIRHRRSGRSGYGYPVEGRVKIEGLREGLYVGHIIESFLPSRRGSFVIADEPAKELPTPVPGPEGITGVVIPNFMTSALLSGTNLEVFIDRGSEDGVAPGMVFRVHRQFDPATERRLTDEDFLIEADILIVAVSAEHSSGVVIASRMPIQAGDEATLLTDVSDAGPKFPYFRGQGTSKGVDDELDRLDRENRGAIQKKEKRELEQLEKWKENPPELDQQLDQSLDKAPETTPSGPTIPEAQAAPTPAPTTVPAPPADAPAVEAPPASDPALDAPLDAPPASGAEDLAPPSS